MARITRSILEAQAQRLVANIAEQGVTGKKFRLGRQYGRWQLEVVVNDAGGIRTLSELLSSGEMSSALTMANQLLEYMEQERKSGTNTVE